MKVYTFAHIGFVFYSKDRTQDKIGGEEINKKLLFSYYGSLVTNHVTLAVVQTIQIKCCSLCIETTLFRRRLTMMCPLGIIYVFIFTSH